MYDTQASPGKVDYLVHNEVAVTVEHDAAHECHSPLRGKGRQSAVLCLARISLESCTSQLGPPAPSQLGPLARPGPEAAVTLYQREAVLLSIQQ